jgi:hypothetical protein
MVFISSIVVSVRAGCIVAISPTVGPTDVTFARRHIVAFGGVVMPLTAAAMRAGCTHILHSESTCADVSSSSSSSSSSSASHARSPELHGDSGSQTFAAVVSPTWVSESVRESRRLDESAFAVKADAALPVFATPHWHPRQ